MVGAIHSTGAQRAAVLMRAAILQGIVLRLEHTSANAQLSQSKEGRQYFTQTIRWNNGIILSQQWDKPFPSDVPVDG